MGSQILNSYNCSQPVVPGHSIDHFLAYALKRFNVVRLYSNAE